MVSRFESLLQCYQEHCVARSATLLHLHDTDALSVQEVRCPLLVSCAQCMCAMAELWWAAGIWCCKAVCVHTVSRVGCLAVTVKLFDPTATRHNNRHVFAACQVSMSALAAGWNALVLDLRERDLLNNKELAALTFEQLQLTHSQKQHLRELPHVGHLGLTSVLPARCGFPLLCHLSNQCLPGGCAGRSMDPIAVGRSSPPTIEYPGMHPCLYLSSMVGMMRRLSLQQAVQNCLQSSLRLGHAQAVWQPHFAASLTAVRTCWMLNLAHLPMPHLAALTVRTQLVPFLRVVPEQLSHHGPFVYKPHSCSVLCWDDTTCHAWQCCVCRCFMAGAVPDLASGSTGSAHHLWVGRVAFGWLLWVAWQTGLLYDDNDVRVGGW
jgi:hypothetical protein